MCANPASSLADDVWTAVAQRAPSIEQLEVHEGFGKQNVYTPVHIIQYPVLPVPALTTTQWSDLPRFECLQVLRLAVITRVGLLALAHARCGLTELSVDFFSSGSKGGTTGVVDMKADTAALTAVARRHGPSLQRLRLHLLTTDACEDFVGHCLKLLHLDHGDVHSTAHATHNELRYYPDKNHPLRYLRHEVVGTRGMMGIDQDDATKDTAMMVLKTYAATIRAILRSCPQLMTCAGLFTQCTVRRRLINAGMKCHSQVVYGGMKSGRESMAAAYACGIRFMCQFFADHVFGSETKIGDCWNLQYFYGFQLDGIID